MDAEPAPAPVLAPGGGIPHLLVVEADPALGLIFQDALALMGYASTACASVEAALPVLHQQSFDLVLTSQWRTGHPPHEHWATLYPLLALSHPIPVVLCTTWPVEEVTVQHEGFAGVVREPCTLDQLVTTVAACLRQPWNPDLIVQKAVVQRFVACFRREDVAGLVAMCTEDVRWYPWIVPPYPRARPVAGRDALRAYLQETNEYFGVFQSAAMHLYPCPHGIAVRMQMRWQAPSGALAGQMVACCVQVTADGQIRQVGLPPPDERLLAPLSPLRGGG
jgi:CheY-like chemotaxis protein